MSNQWEKIYIKEVNISAGGNFLVDSQLEVDNQIFHLSAEAACSMFSRLVKKPKPKPNQTFPRGKKKRRKILSSGSSNSQRRNKVQMKYLEV